MPQLLTTNSLVKGFTYNQPIQTAKVQGPGLGNGGINDYYVPSTSNVLGTSTSTPYQTSQGVATKAANNSFNTGITNLQQNTNTGNDLIEQDYNNTVSSINSQESGIRRQAGLASSQIDTEGSSVVNQIQDAQTQAEQGVSSQLQTGEKTAASQLQNARDLYREVEQRNSAQLSGLGISSSSVTEALAERLGVETARRIAGVNSNLGEIRQNATQELSRIKNFYTNKITDVKSQVQNQKATIQSNLMSAIDQTNNARNVAATARAQQRQELIINAQNQLASLQNNYDQFQVQLAQWAQTKSSALTPLSQGDFNSVMGNQINKLQQQFNPTQFDITPTVNTNQYGYSNSQINVTPKKPQVGDTKTVGEKTYFFDGSNWSEGL